MTLSKRAAAAFLVLASSACGRSIAADFDGGPNPPTADAGLSPWPMYAGGPRQTGRSLAVGPSSPHVKWFFPTGSVGGQPAIAGDGTIYFATPGTLYAIDADGALRWTFSTSTDGVWGPPTPAIGADGTVFVSAGERLYALTPAGALHWSVALPPDLERSAPTIGPDGTLYLANQAAIYAFRSDGTQAWSATKGNIRVPTVAAIGPDGTVHVSVVSGDPETDNYTNATLATFSSSGLAGWSAPEGPNGMDIGSIAVGDDGTIYQQAANKLYAIGPGGAVAWESPVGVGLSSGTPVVGADGTIYADGADPESGAQAMWAIEPDGGILWTSPLPTSCGFNDLCGYDGAPVVDGHGTVYVEVPFVGLVAVGPDGGTAWIFPQSFNTNASPAIGADGTLYLPGGSPDSSAPDEAGLYALTNAP